jgi:hypothetical protein
MNKGNRKEIARIFFSNARNLVYKINAQCSKNTVACAIENRACCIHTIFKGEQFGRQRRIVTATSEDGRSK